MPAARLLFNEIFHQHAGEDQKPADQAESDEHGVAISMKAKKEGRLSLPPKVIGEKLKGRYQNSMHPRTASELNSIDVISEGTDYSR